MREPATPSSTPLAPDSLGSLAFTSLAHFINDGSGVLVSIVAAFLAATGVPPLFVAGMFAGYSATSVFASPIVGWWADWSGRPGRLIGIGLAIVSVGLLGFYLGLAFTSGGWLLLATGISALLMGFGSSFYHPLGGTILQSKFDGRTRGKALGINGAAGSVGRAIYPVLFIGILVALSGDEPLAVFALIGFAAAAAIWVRLRERVAVRRETGSANGKARDVATKGLVALTLVVLVRSIATVGIGQFIPTFLSQERGLGIGAGLLIAVTTVYAPAIVGQPFFGILVDRFDKRYILGLSSLGSALSVLAAVVTSGFVSVAFLALFGFFTFSGFPLFFSLVADYVPRNSSSLGNSLVWGLGATGGGVLGPLVTGAIILTDYARLGYAFELLAGVAIVSALGTMLIPKSAESGKVPLFG